MEETKPNFFRATAMFFQKCSRVLRVARKPTGEEVRQTSKVSALGIAVIGFIGFVVGLVYILFFS